MKKLISTLLASAMCLTAVPFTAFADETVNMEDVMTLAENLDNGNTSEWTVDEEATNANFELMKKGEYPLDFNGDGKINYWDVCTICEYYAEVQTQTIDKDGNEIGDAEPRLDAETRKRVHDYGDIVVHVGGITQVDTLDASYMLMFLMENGYTGDGDVNYDGTVDALDASLVLTAYSYKQTYVEPELEQGDMQELYPSIKCAGDVNHDGNLDALDASLILAQYSEAQTNKQSL